LPFKKLLANKKTRKDYPKRLINQLKIKNKNVYPSKSLKHYNIGVYLVANNALLGQDT
jgi:hypothetical protein